MCSPNTGRIFAALCTLVTVAGFDVTLGGSSAPATERTRDESTLLSRVRQLTFDGRRAGEGYFSADGTKLVFQSERIEDNPFFQIYELDLTSGDNRMVSTGLGKTTCAFYQSGTDDILFGSTHHDPRSRELQQQELDFRASGQERRYAWDFDPEMDVYVARQKSRELVRLTSAHGYDAEGSYSPDGQWIVFTSTRDAYGRELSKAEQDRLATDPSFFGELYVMRADGSEQRRLTRTPGYDGGPFFLPDGKRVVWRRFDEQGLVADVWTVGMDGSEPRQVTDFKSMSWAPFPHPSGDYLIFTSNIHGFENFELFIVDTHGRRQPQRVTFTKGFDGLPVFAPDGRRLAWTSTRRSEQGQIFFGNWNHDRALEILKNAPLRED